MRHVAIYEASLKFPLFTLMQCSAAKGDYGYKFTQYMLHIIRFKYLEYSPVNLSINQAGHFVRHRGIPVWTAD